MNEPQHHHRLHADDLVHLEQAVVETVAKKQEAAQQRFRLPFALLGTFGLVATFYGFEHMIDSVPVLVENPIIMLAVGVGALVATGSLYRKLL